MNRKIVSDRVDVPEGVLYAAKSYFADRVEPGVEKIIMPSYVLPQGDISCVLSKNYILDFSRMYSSKKRLFLAAKNLFRIENLSDDFIYVNFRDYTPENWAHSLDFYLPFAVFLINDNEVRALRRPICFILPHTTPSYIKEVFELFGLKFLLFRNKVQGDFIDVNFNPFSCIRCFSRSWVEAYFFTQDAYGELDSNKNFLDKKIFISRKDTRKILNEDEIEKYLLSLGYVKKYAEDLSVADQFRVYMHASDIVAVHGASIAPMLYRNARQKKLKIVEIFNPGHMTNFYRGVAADVNAYWVGVRGRISHKMIKDAYNFKESYIKHSLTDFIVDLDSLNCALAHLEKESQT